MEGASAYLTRAQRDASAMKSTLEINARLAQLATKSIQIRDAIQPIVQRATVVALKQLPSQERAN